MWRDVWWVFRDVGTNNFAGFHASSPLLYFIHSSFCVQAFEYRYCFGLWIGLIKIILSWMSYWWNPKVECQRSLKYEWIISIGMSRYLRRKPNPNLNTSHRLDKYSVSDYEIRNIDTAVHRVYWPKYVDTNIVASYTIIKVNTSIQINRKMLELPYNYLIPDKNSYFCVHRIV